MSDRDALTSRTIPFMTLSDGTASSQTAPPPSLDASLNADEKAKARFTIDGNIIGVYFRIL